MASTHPPGDRGDFEIAVICALPLEAECVYDALDKIWDDKKYGKAPSDENAYSLGVIGEHNVVLVHMPGMGTIRAAYAAGNLKMSFPNIKLALVVGVCGGMPFGTKNEEVLLGDVVISKALIQYDFGKQYPQGFKRKTDVLDTLGPPSEQILALLAKLGTRQHMQDMQNDTATFLQAIQQKSSTTKHPGIENDILYHPSYTHQHHSPIPCDECRKGDEICKVAVAMECEDLGCESVMRVTRKRLVNPSTTQPLIHFGIMGSGDTVMKSGHHRDALAQNEGIVAVEMEGAGVWRHGPSIVIKGVSDYADSHKRKGWQGYAAATAAACTKAFLMEWTPEKRHSNSVDEARINENFLVPRRLVKDFLKKEVGVTPAQIDEVIQKRYDDRRLNVERLSGKSLPLEYCFINLSIIDHVRDSDTRSASNESDRDEAAKRLSKFSLAARLKVETPPQSRQVSLSTLFEPRKQKDGTQRRPNRVLIWGRAGMGKTTLCKKIVHEIYKNGLWKDLYDRVIWLPLRRLKRIESRNTIELLQNEFPFTGLGERVPEALNKLVQDERTLFLLDGLDEVSFALDQDSPRGCVLQDLVSRSHVIITSRPHHTRILDHKPPDLELETVGFFPQQIEEYLQVAAKPNIEDIRSFIQERPLVKSLAAIPIQLDAICNTWNMKSFPRDNATMTTLYRMISQSLWKNSILRLEKIGDDGQPVTMQRLEHWSWPYLKNFIEAEIVFLQELGFWGLCKDVSEFSVDNIEILKASRQISSDKIVHLSFLRVSDSSVEVDQRTFHFIHPTFQEFFAAQYFVRYWTSNKPLPLWEQTLYDTLSDQSTRSVTPEEFVKSRKYIDRYDIFWRFVIGLLLTERNNEHYRFLDTLAAEPVDLIGLTHQRLIVHCLSELDEDDNKLRCRVRNLEDSYLQWALYESRLNRNRGRFQLTPLIWEAEYSDYIMERLLNKEETEQGALEMLYRRSSISSKMLDTVIQKLSESTSEDIRKITIQIIGQHCGHNQKEKVDKLFNDVQYLRTTPWEIIHAWKGTSRLLEPAIKTVVRLLQDPDWNIRSEAVKALREQTTLRSTVVEALVQLLQHPDRGVRSEAVSALRQQATLPSTAAEALVRLLQHPDWGDRYQAASALGEQTTLPSTVVEALVRLLQHPNIGVQSDAASALRQQTTLPSTVVEALVQLLQDSDKDIRSKAASTLRRQTTLPSTVAEALVRLLQHPNIGVRFDAASALRQQATLRSTAVEAFVRLLQHPDRGVRHQAVGALGQQTTLPSTVVEALVRLLQDPDWGVQFDAASALRRQTTLPSTVVEALVQLLQHPDRDVRYQAVSALGQQTTLPSTAVEALVRLLQDPSWDVLSKAVSALGRQTTLRSTAVEALVRLLQHPDRGVRSEAVSALRQQATLPSTVVEALVQLLQDPDWGVRYQAVSALGEQTTLPSTVVEAFVQLLQHPNRDVRSEAASALRRQTTLPSTVVEALVRLLQHPNRDVRSEVASALEEQTTLRSTVVEALVRLLQHPDWDVRYQAVSALRRQTTLPSTVVEALVRLLQDPNISVRYQVASALEEQTTLPSTVVEALVQLLQHPDRGVQFDAASALRRQTTLPSTAAEALVRLLQDPDRGVRHQAVGALRDQATLPSTVVEALVQLLQYQDEPAHEEVIDLIFSRREVQSLVPTLSSSTLQHFIKHCFSKSSVICFVEKDCFCIRAMGHFQRIPLQQHQLEPFSAEWQKARESLRLPSLMPIFSTSVISNTTSSTHLRP